MKTSRSNSNEPLSTRELVRYLRRMSALNRDPRTGNPRLSEALDELADALGSGDRTTAAPSRKTREASRQDGQNPDFETFSGEEVISFIRRDDVPKITLVELARQRFSIPRSRLLKLSSDKVVDLIVAALDHENSLNALSREAQRGGSKRSS